MTQWIDLREDKPTFVGCIYLSLIYYTPHNGACLKIDLNKLNGKLRVIVIGCIKETKI
jgi:hypothetical protein